MKCRIVAANLREFRGVFGLRVKNWLEQDPS